MGRLEMDLIHLGKFRVNDVRPQLADKSLTLAANPPRLSAAGHSQPSPTAPEPEHRHPPL
jgi:hypothetical protein